MKSNVLCVCVVLVLMACSIASGTIVPFESSSGCAGPTFCSPTAYASGSSPSSRYEGYGQNGAYTTEACYADWNTYYYAYADAYLTLYNMESCLAVAQAEAGVGNPNGGGYGAAFVLLEDAWVNGYHEEDSDGAYTDSDFSFTWFDVNGGVSAYVYGGAGAGVPEGATSRAYAHACAQAEATMEEW